jgi:hypothetical protein
MTLDRVFQSEADRDNPSRSLASTPKVRYLYYFRHHCSGAAEQQFALSPE